MHVAAIALTLALASPGAFLERISAQAQTTSATKPSSRRMEDGKHWTTENLNVSTVPSSCYEDAERIAAVIGRSRFGGRPAAFKMRAVVERPT